MKKNKCAIVAQVASTNPISSLTKSSLEKAVSEFNAAPPLVRKGKTLPPKIRVGNKSYRVIRELGTGADGVVFEVADGETRKVVKKYWSEGFEKGNLAKFPVLEKAGFRVPQVYEVDKTKRTVLMEFVRGVPCDFLQNSKTLAEEERQQAASDYSSFWKVAGKFAELEPQNVLVEVDTGQFVIIDP